MTLRKIHNNIINFRQSPYNKNHQPDLYQHYDYDQEPKPPQTFIANSNTKRKVQKDLKIIKQKTVNSNIKKYQKIQLNVLQNYKNNNKNLNKIINDKKQINDNSQKSELFIPERKKSIKTNHINNTRDRLHNQSLSNSKQIIKRSISLFNSPIKQQLIYKKKTNNLKYNTINVSRMSRLQNGQRQHEILLKNRLNYISIDEQRQRQKIQIVRRKYQKVLSVRNQSLKQKQNFHKRKLQSYFQERKDKHAKIQNIQMQKSQRKLSISKLRQLKTMTAFQVRNQNKFNNEEIKSKQLTALNLKKQLVRKVRSSLQSSRDKINQNYRSRISSVRSIENKRLVSNYVNFQKRQKQTQKLYEKLQKEIKIINERKLKAASQLKQYEAILIPKKNENNLNQSKISKKGSKSFYITHY